MGNRMVSIRSGFALLLAVSAMAGCGNGKDPAELSAAGRPSVVLPVALKTYGVDQRDAIRVRMDTARSRLWVLGLEHVRVYDTATKQRIWQVELPGWSVYDADCMPDLVVDASGSAFVSSNVVPQLWRIDADSFEVRAQEITLRGRENWDTGFAALAFNRDGALYALTSTANSLWSIDVANASAEMIEAYHPPTKGCSLTTLASSRRVAH
jgi:hypothetical protein